jgi:N-glycosylase/DNA lyase
LGVFKNLITERTVEEVQAMIKDNLESNAIYWKILWRDSKRRLKKAEKILKEIRENSNPSYLKDRVDEYFEEDNNA